MKKNITVIVLALVMTLSFAACGTKTTETPSEKIVAETIEDATKDPKVTDTEPVVVKIDEMTTDRTLSGTYTEIAREREGFDPEFIAQDLKEHPATFTFNEDGTVEYHHWDIDVTTEEGTRVERVDSEIYAVKDNTLYISRDHGSPQSWTQEYTLEGDNKFTGTNSGYTVTFEKQ